MAAELFGGGGQPGSGAAEYGYGCPCAGQAVGEPQADAGAAAGDDRNVAGQIEEVGECCIGHEPTLRRHAARKRGRPLPGEGFATLLQVQARQHDCPITTSPSDHPA